MAQALHIFLKDSRRFRYPILVTLAWTTTFVIDAARLLPELPSQPGLVADFSNLVLPLLWGYLIARSIHADALAGDRQFWVTRPYSRVSLFLAKLLFVVAYVLVPFGIAQASIVTLRGLPLAEYLPALLWEHVLIIAMIVLPAASIASVTTSLPQFIGVAFSLALLAIVLYSGNRWPGVEWVRTSLLSGAFAAITVAVVWLQFARRRTMTSRLAGLAGTLVVVAAVALLSWPAAFRLQSRLAHGRNAEVTAEIVAPLRKPGQPRTEIRERLLLSQLQFRLNPPPDGAPFACDATELTIDAPDGTTWSSGPDLIGVSRAVWQTPADVPVAIRMPRPLADATLRQPVSIRARFFVTTFADTATRVPVDNRRVFVDAVGVCSGSTYDQPMPSLNGETWTRIDCLNAFTQPRFMLFTPVQGAAFSPSARSYSPFPAELRLQPVKAWSIVVRPVEEVTIRTLTPKAHFETTLELHGVDLRDFMP